MNKYLTAALLSLMFATTARADHDNTSAIDKGTYIDIARVSGSSTAGTAFPSNSAKMMDGIYFNNTANTIWIGTTTASQHMVQHSNITNGFPVLSSATFSFNGKFTGAAWFTCGVGIATCEVRRLEGFNR